MPDPRPAGYRCFGCGLNSSRYGQRYCRRCHAKYMRDWRAKEKKRIAQLLKGVQ